MLYSIYDLNSFLSIYSRNQVKKPVYYSFDLQLLQQSYL